MLYPVPAHYYLGRARDGAEESAVCGLVSRIFAVPRQLGGRPARTRRPQAHRELSGFPPRRNLTPHTRSPLAHAVRRSTRRGAR